MPGTVNPATICGEECYGPKGELTSAIFNCILNSKRYSKYLSLYQEVSVDLLIKELLLAVPRDYCRNSHRVKIQRINDHGMPGPN